MKKQNKSLLMICAFILGLLVVIFKFSSGEDAKKNSAAIEVKDETNSNLPEPTQEAMGEPVHDVGAVAPIVGDEEKLFSFILADLSNCLDMKSNLGESMPLSIESILTSVQGDLGPAVGQADRAMNWHLKNREGIERRVRLEITEGDDGKIYREMKYFAVDNEGLPIPMELPLEKRNNPSDEIVNQMLKEGDVFFKEKSAYAVFADGARIEFSEKNGQLADFEFQKGDRYFRCQNLKIRDACQCIK